MTNKKTVEVRTLNQDEKVMIKPSRMKSEWLLKVKSKIT